MSTSLHPSSLSIAERTGAHAGLMHVASREQISPSLVAVTLRGNAAVMAGVAGQDVMIRLEDNGVGLRRRYSVAHLDEANDSLTLWISTTHQGPAAQWAQSCEIDSAVDVVGPRGKIFLDPLADWHLFIGDISALGAFYRLAHQIDVPGRAIFIVEIDDPADAVTTEFDEGLGITAIFVDRHGRDHSDPTGALSGLAAFAFPADEGHAYLFGEFHVVAAVRVALRDRGLADDAVSFKAFYRAGLANRDGGEPVKD